MNPIASNLGLLADSISDISHTFQLFMQSVYYHLQSIDDRINDLQEEINVFKEENDIE